MKVERIKISQIDFKENSRANVDKQTSMLMNSIQQHGLMQPIGVEICDNGRFNIKFGNRRVNACNKLGWLSIPAVLYPKENDTKDLLIKNLVENIQREDVSPAEIGRICEQLEKKGLDLKEIAIRLDLPESTVKSLLVLYKEIPASIRDKVIFHKIGMKKNGMLSVDNITKIVNLRTRFGLSHATTRKLIEYSRLNELSNDDIQIIGLLMQNGLTLTKALAQKKNYRTYRVDLIGLKEEVDDLSKSKNVSAINYLAQVCYGLQGGISKPSFINFSNPPKLGRPRYKGKK